MAHARFCADSSPKMVGLVKVLVLSSMCPCEVAAQTNARLGRVSVGAEENHWSQTAKPRARPDSTGSICGVNIPMILDATVPGRMDQLGSLACHPSVSAKAVRRPGLGA